MTRVPPPPLPLDQLPAGYQLHAGMGRATIHPDMDFETYSEAGFLWDDATEKWTCLPGASQGKKGLPIVGAASYAEHPTTEVLCLWYDLKDGRGRRFWRPGMPNPQDLFDHIAAGRVIEAWNVGFERWIWEKVCMPKYGWPFLPHKQYRCAMAKARASAYPGALGKAGEVMRLTQQKDKEGDRLLKKFSVPRQPTAKDKRKRITPVEDHAYHQGLMKFRNAAPGEVLPSSDAEKLYAYGEQDIVTEAEASSKVPDQEGEEFEYWQVDQAINYRGVQMDVPSIRNCVAIIDQAHEQYNGELRAITGGVVERASELQKLQAWLHSNGVHLDSLDEEHLTEALANDDAALKGATWSDGRPRQTMWPPARRALEIRAAVGSAAVKKVFAMKNQVTRAGRLHDLFSYHAARTGRATGNGPQPTNLPNSGPEILVCGCKRHFGKHLTVCPWCQMPQPPGKKPEEWSEFAVEDALLVIATQSLAVVEAFYGDAMAVVSGCLRGLFIAAPGKRLICSDYNSIEAVVLAEIAGEEWRREVFRTHGKIYEMSAAKIAGIPFEDFMRHAGYSDAELTAPDWYTRKPAAKGSHHPLRKTIGKVAELASGYQGWIGSWVAFGADAFMDEAAMKKAILAWRAASPKIVEFWGGQERNWMPEMFGVEGMFVSAITNPGVTYTFRGFEFTMKGDALYLRLLSGRYLTYHAPRLEPGTRSHSNALAISYEGWNTNPKNGPTGWIRMRTWGGRLTENIVQATARDIQRYGMINLEKAGYPIVLHVYDEDIVEVPEGFGSLEEVERIMATMPPWCADWPIKASGGWTSLRYHK